ncbi:hypothetical protein A2Z33_01805 [Candidatus Gottesmanbacteria bacterium RBG_16_52_11]|uniref:Uncharacterized protein n=1 Tax=Candidatus Gottesmanbacteria bacterium RBG_16_52_11 TaxID=1798374 RepID=A0A1F5YR16_9BACT|nr:MAG: hypothetical protein A2Z33_01805 [Candidatus Gottesmanbacteria bacterium RBG_16_52_11]
MHPAFVPALPHGKAWNPTPSLYLIVSIITGKTLIFLPSDRMPDELVLSVAQTLTDIQAVIQNARCEGLRIVPRCVYEQAD